MEPIIPVPADILEKKSERENLNFMLHFPKTYVMDNHLGAGWCWLQELDCSKQYCFFHIDRHEDLSGWRDPKSFEFLKDNPKISIAEYTGLAFQDDTHQEKVFVWDNYIKTIQKIFPDWFAKCYFACHSHVCDPSHSTSIPLNIVDNVGPLELYNSIKCWVKNEREQFILNLDVDYFFDDEGMQLFSEDYIKTFARNLNSAMENIAVLTIALSPECCGGWEKAFHVYDIIAEELDMID